MKHLFLGLLVAGLSVGAAQAATYDIDASHSSVRFEVKHLGIGNFHARFNAFSGTFKPGKAFKIEIRTGSVYSANKKRDGHLKNPDFFNSKQFPTATFVAKEWKGEVIKGDLTIRGITKPVTAKVKKIGEGKDPWGNYRIGYDAELKINRMDFDVKYMPDGLGKEVIIRISLEGVKKKG